MKRYIPLPLRTGKKIIILMEQDKCFEEQFSQYAADHFAKYRSYKDWLGFGSKISSKSCAKNALQCFQRCLDGMAKPVFGPLNPLKNNLNSS